MITFLTIIMAILASITPAGNAIIDFTGLTGVYVEYYGVLFQLLLVALLVLLINKKKKGL